MSKPDKPAQTVTEAFDQLDERLKLDPAERDRAIRIHNDITTSLKEALVVILAFLQGSFARKTMLAPLRDIDKVVIIRWDRRDVGPGSAMRAARRVAAALRELYPEYRVSIGKHCVLLELADDDFTFDIVPAIECDDDSGDVLIIDTEQDRWERSNTRTLIASTQARNQDCDGRWVRQVRFVKLYVREQLHGLVKGIHVEKFGWDAVKDTMPHDEAVAAILAVGADLLTPGVAYTDPTGFDRIDDRLDPQERIIAHREFQRAAEQAARAVELARNGEHNAAIAIWSDLFGEEFPQPDAAAAIDDLGRGKGIASVITSTAPLAPRPTRAWRSEA
jgi:hypothetical protein